MNGRAGIAMTLHRTACRAVRVLEPSAVDRVGSFLSGCRGSEGGFRGRGDDSDLYYTSFALASLRALHQPVPTRTLAQYLAAHAVEELDLVHLISLLQCKRLLHPLGIPRRLKHRGAAALDRFKTADGGYATQIEAGLATAYGTYLALLGHDVLGRKFDEREALAQTACRLLQSHLRDPGSRANLQGLAASALSVHALSGQVDPEYIADEMRCYRATDGGYRANPSVDTADLLSTAVAAFALRFLGKALRGGDALATASFVHSLWDDAGGFRGHADDDQPDCEYTFYALLTMGALEP